MNHKMANLMENKQQMYHIASEIVVLFGITFYFNQKNKKLMTHIEDLSQRVEDQEDLIEKHEQMIRKLVEFVNQQSLPKNPPPASTPSIVQLKDSHSDKAPVKRVRYNKRSKSTTIEKAPLVSNNISVDTTYKNEEEEEGHTYEISSLSENESENLDADILDELEELKESDNKVSLKKKQ